MKSIGIVIPYYGVFPNYFELFLKSCEKNPTIDWLIFTDIEDAYDYPQNVQRIHMTFTEIKDLFQSKFDFPIVLENPYKLCDYKPMLGYLFSDYLKKYDYWGHSDVDMLFGDFRKFLPDAKLERYDKIGHLGHLTLYRNTEDINRLFMKSIYQKERYKEVLSVQNNLAFDEWHQIGINEIFINQKKSILFYNDFFDVEAFEENFHRISLDVNYDNMQGRQWIKEKKASFASWEDGRVYQWSKENGSWKKEEYMYVHFQKRQMEVCVDIKKTDRFLCVPNQFVPYDEMIPRKYTRRSLIMGIFNKKHWKQWFKKVRYTVIEKTGPIRHVFKRK